MSVIPVCSDYIMYTTKTYNIQGQLLLKTKCSIPSKAIWCMVVKMTIKLIKFITVSPSFMHGDFQTIQ